MHGCRFLVFAEETASANKNIGRALVMIFINLKQKIIIVGRNSICSCGDFHTK